MDGYSPIEDNLSKTEFIYFGNKIQLRKCPTVRLNINGDLIERTDVIHYLGAWMGSSLTYKTHINKKCQAAMTNFQRIKSIRHLLDDHSCADLCISLCISPLDYANALLYGLPEASISKLQHVQNMCAKSALRKGKYDSPSECMFHLYWLPIRQCISFKILVLTHKCPNGIGPQYLKDLIVELKPTRPRLRSKTTHRLLTPKTSYKTFAARLFSVAAPVLWNSLPEDIKNITSVLSFKKALKTHLFKVAYNVS